MATEWERTQRRIQTEEEFAAREDDAARHNGALQRWLETLDLVLRQGVAAAPTLDYRRRRQQLPDEGDVPVPDPGPEPVEADYALPEPGVLARMAPKWERRHRERQRSAREHFLLAHRTWSDHKDEQDTDYVSRRAAVRARRRSAVAANEALDRFEVEAPTGTRASVEDYVLDALRRSRYPFAVVPVARFVPSRGEILLEVEFPPVDDVVPEYASWVHVKSRKVVEPKKRTEASRKDIYRRLIAQITLRSLYECFHVDRFGHIHAISFKGVVAGISKTTGYPVTPTVVSLRVTREDFLDRDFQQVDPVRLLKALRANVSDEPQELKAVPLVVEFDLSDPRFIEEEDVIASMDDRQNLMDLSPANFEYVITNLFNRMGYDAKPTVRSKDGGVDCIAAYKAPAGVFKCVIQAKRYTASVGVEAIRDLSGAMHHEQASTGFLVTTSRVTSAGWKFAEGKPIEIIEGEHLLGLFEKYTDLRLTIVFPPKDP